MSSLSSLYHLIFLVCPPPPRPPSCSVEALKTLMRSAGYSDHVSYIQKLQGWELLTSLERHHEGVALLGR